MCQVWKHFVHSCPIDCEGILYDRAPGGQGFSLMSVFPPPPLSLQTITTTLIYLTRHSATTHFSMTNAHLTGVLRVYRSHWSRMLIKYQQWSMRRVLTDDLNRCQWRTVTLIVRTKVILKKLEISAKTEVQIY